MANVTITVSEKLLKAARRRALQQGTSVNALLHEFLSQFAATHSAHANAAQRVLELSRISRAGSGKAKWARADVHQR